jgi:hypothetical protein
VKKRFRSNTPEGEEESQLPADGRNERLPLTVESVDGKGVSAVKRDEPLQRIRVVRVEVGESRHHDEVDHLVLPSRMLRADLAAARFLRKRRARATALWKLLGASDILRRNVAGRSARQRAAGRGARLETGRARLEARVLVLRILAGPMRTRARARVGAARGARTGGRSTNRGIRARKPSSSRARAGRDQTLRRSAGEPCSLSSGRGRTGARRKGVHRTLRRNGASAGRIRSPEVQRGLLQSVENQLLIPLRRSSSDGAHRRGVLFLL